MAMIAGEIIRDSDKLTEIWDQLNYYDKHKTLRDDNLSKKSSVEDLDIPEIITRLLTLPSFITKTSKKLALMPEGAEKESLKTLIESKKTELQEIKNLRYK